MTAPNLLALTTVTGKTGGLAVTTSAAAIVANAGSSGKLLKLETLIVANVDGSTNAEITIDHYRGSTPMHIGKSVVTPTKAGLNYLESPVYLEEGDSLRLTANADGDLEAVCSYLDMS